MGFDSHYLLSPYFNFYLLSLSFWNCRVFQHSQGPSHGQVEGLWLRQGRVFVVMMHIMHYMGVGYKTPPFGECAVFYLFFPPPLPPSLSPFQYFRFLDAALALEDCEPSYKAIFAQARPSGAPSRSGSSADRPSYSNSGPPAMMGAEYLPPPKQAIQNILMPMPDQVGHF